MARTLGLMVAWTLASSVQAQGAPPAEYEAAIDVAVDEFQAGHWSEARAKFEEANQLYPNARAIRGIGMTAFELADYVGAEHALRRSLDSEVRPLSAQQREHVESLLARCTQYLGIYTLQPMPGTHLYVDGEPHELEGWPEGVGRLVLGRGQHEIEVRADDGGSASRLLRVSGGESGLLPLRVEPRPQPEPEPEPEPGRQEPVPVETIELSRLDDPEPERNRRGGWAAFGLGLGAAAAGAVLLGTGVADANRVADAAAGTEWSTLRGSYERGPVLRGVGIAMISGGVIAALVGLVVQLNQEPGDEGSLALRGTSLELTW